MALPDRRLQMNNYELASSYDTSTLQQDSLNRYFVNTSKNLHYAMENLDSLPAIPSIAQKILSLKITTDEGEQALLELIEKDPPILSRIVGLANSPLFGTGRKILTLHDAAALLGSNRIKMVALSFAIISFMAKKSGGLINIEGLWKHSLSVTMAMDTLARNMPKDRRPPDDEIYLGGLLHDIGFMVLDYLDPQLSNKFHARLAAEPGRQIDEIESEMLWMNHSDLGAELARRWGLPECIILMLRYHHSANDERAAPGQPLVAMAGLAGKLLPTFGIDESVQVDITDEEWLTLGIDPIKGDEIKARIQNHTREVAAIYI